MSGPPKASTLLNLLEPGWRRHLASGELAGTLDVEPEMLDAAALALGVLSRSQPPAVLSRRWPALSGSLTVPPAARPSHRERCQRIAAGPAQLR